MNKLNIFQKLLIWIMSIIFVMTIIFSIFKISVVEKVNTEVFNMVTAIRYTFLEKPVQSTKKQINDFLSLEIIRDENDKLKENMESIGRYQAEIAELKRQNQELQDLLNFQDENSNLQLKTAQVIFRDYERWNNTIKINIGSDENVKVNDAVVIAQGLIGRVETVDKNTSIIRLLISNEKVSKVAVKIQTGKDDYVEGIVDLYDSNSKKFKLSLLETSDDIKEGQVVITSGSGGTIPSGILVGYISSVEESVSELAESISVTPSANFESFEKLFVVTGSLDE